MGRTAATVEEAFEEFPNDFCAYLARRLGVERPAAVEVLGDWMRHYEPSPEAARRRRTDLGQAIARATARDARSRENQAA